MPREPPLQMVKGICVEGSYRNNVNFQGANEDPGEIQGWKIESCQFNNGGTGFPIFVSYG